MSGALQAVYANFRSSAVATYIEDVFSTYLYTGNGSTQTITNGIDLAGKGGLVWQKTRNDVVPHDLNDTARGVGKVLQTDSTDPQANYADLTSFNSNGFTVNFYTGWINGSGNPCVSWTFRKQPKFFDIVTYTGNGVAGREISHSLGSAPGCVIIKNTSNVANWRVWHRSQTGKYANLNEAIAFQTDSGTIFGNNSIAIAPTSTVITVGTNQSVNSNGQTYVAYIYAHNAGGFGLSGNENVISCGSYTGTGGTTANSVTLGYEPQWVMIKASSTTSNWFMYDTMRGWSDGASEDKYLWAQSSIAEGDAEAGRPNATGFNPQTNVNDVGVTYIYIAIRRGPMQVPTMGTSVFQVYAASDTTTQTTGFPVDMFFDASRSGNALNTITMSRLIGPALSLVTSSAAAESGGAGDIGTAFQNNTTFRPGIGFNWWAAFRRAPGFFDQVCYTGTGVARTVAHNLTVVPELMIVKQRDAAQNGVVYVASSGNSNYLRLFSNSSDSGDTPAAFWNNTTPTSSVFSVGTNGVVNGSGSPYVAYLFATCPNVSKVGSYTGTGATQTINAGLASGARFVLIKKSTSTAPDRNWFVWDTARGMVAGTDPRLTLNTTAAESNANWVYTAATGFQIVTTDDSVNALGVTYIYLAIA